ncbi:hypothetical protein TSUD_367210 [Trifolium subterraneum]|uniref:Uncharacterized protein n=1 Tax=Trifolium subterraneum TaxID=3900 RepID=A0A2Z6P8I8_TRISU|nr:hypothetical protein TSUD_367210 [Trifolium subterraneum]
MQKRKITSTKYLAKMDHRHQNSNMPRRERHKTKLLKLKCIKTGAHFRQTVPRKLTSNKHLHRMKMNI